VGSGPELVQLTVCPLEEQLQPVPVPEIKLNPAGRISVTVVTPVELNMPAAFDTVSK